MENYREKVAGFTDEQLNVYIEQRYKYIPEIVLAAVAELQGRGRVFSEEELNAIYEEIQTRPGEERQPEEVQPLPVAEMQEYYSPQFIRISSVLFSTFFGAILMAMNLWRAGEKKGMYQALIFGFVYTVALMILGSYLPANSGGFGIILNFAGGIMLEYFFWNKYIGAQTAFKKRNFIFPLLIGIAISAVIIAVVFTELK